MHPVLKQMLPAAAAATSGAAAQPAPYTERDTYSRPSEVRGEHTSLPRDPHNGRFLKRGSAPRSVRFYDEEAPPLEKRPHTGGRPPAPTWGDGGYFDETLRGRGMVEVQPGHREAPGVGGIDEGEGMARVGGYELETHPRGQLKRDYHTSRVAPDNVFRQDFSGGRGEAENARDLSFRAGRELSRDLDGERVLSGYDFEQDPDGGRAGPSSGHAHVRAADLATAYQQTVRQERSFQTAFNNTVRNLLAREETSIGLMHLWDFASALAENPASKALTAQLFLVAQHCRDEGAFREAILTLAEPESRWLFDLLDILQSIVVQERQMSLESKVAAINYAVLTLGKHYARRIYRSRFVPLDKEVKVDTFYMRMVMKLLTLAEELGAYRNERLERQIGAGRARRELTDAELLEQLRHSLREGGSALGTAAVAGGAGLATVGVGGGGGGAAATGDEGAEDLDDAASEDDYYDDAQGSDFPPY